MWHGASDRSRQALASATPTANTCEEEPTSLDLEEDNVLVDLECESVLNDFVKQQREAPLPRHDTGNGHPTYLSQSEFGPLRDYFILPEIADLDLAQPGGGSHIHPVQPHRYRAPEIWNLMEGKDLFVNLKDENGQYNSHAHLAEMIALLGEPPKALLQQEKLFRNLTFKPEVQAVNGQACDNTYIFTPSL
ncbi:hypothetical protein B7494_g8495 [Chlorociboria aeruginascens]|nr:hypothetical protein B7494_g8495 [Chlorociboria aeruginascens]